MPAAARTHRNAARWTVALAVGLRQSETLGLRWADVDLANSTLTVRRGLHRVAGQGLVYEEPKADCSRRTLALPTQLVHALNRAAQLEERSTAGSLWEDHDLVWAQANGRPIERKRPRTDVDDHGHAQPCDGGPRRDAAERMGNALWGPPAP